MFGGPRPKKQKLLTNVPSLASLRKRCDNAHWHEPWGLLRGSSGTYFATADEAEYTAELCKALVASVCQDLTPNTMVDSRRRLLRERLLRQRARVAAAAGRQAPRGQQQELVEEYPTVMSMHGYFDVVPIFLRWREHRQAPSFVHGQPIPKG